MIMTLQNNCFSKALLYQGFFMHFYQFIYVKFVQYLGGFICIYLKKGVDITPHKAYNLIIKDKPREGKKGWEL